MPPTELAARREQLAAQYTELQWDLGGLVYEMASRDHFRLDIIIRHAAKLQEVDAELGEVEMLLRLDEAGAAGTCPACGALHARGAVYCWQCGKGLMPQEQVATQASQPAPVAPQQAPSAPAQPAAVPAQPPPIAPPLPAPTLPPQ